MQPAFQATFNRIPASHLAPLTRSSHALLVHNRTAYIYSGELQPRQPVSPSIIRIDLNNDEIATIHPGESAKSSNEPGGRVGASWARHNDDFYLFGGRGGEAMEPLPSQLFKFSTATREWSEVTAVEGEQPESRSYHSSAVLDDTLYIHAGCPATGRLSTLHSFHIPTRTWKALSSAPGPPRGGTVITAAKLSSETSVLLRFGGFGGPTIGELEDLAFYDPESNSWTSVPKPEATSWPEARSVHGFVGLKRREGSDAVAVLLMGEGKPAPAHLGHSGAGNFLSDVWVLHYSDADKTFSWTRASSSAREIAPQGRGWFASDFYNDSDGIQAWKIVFSGGLNEKNERLGDAWILEIEQL